MTNAKGNGSATKHDDPTLRVALFSDLRITRLGRDYEEQAYGAGFQFVAGVDEVGRGSLAGPVVAAACILDRSKPLPRGLNDSKQLAKLQREQIAAKLYKRCIAIAFGQVEAEEIDQINILEASKKAMLLAIGQLRQQPDFLLIDALRLRQSPLPQNPIIRGDSISASIAAASVLAKTYRDDLMRDYDSHFPDYGFSHNVGYGTPEHLTAIRRHGPCPLHRRTFHGVL
jgi:ribonuclease HII